jgi:hypothetical protein
VLGNRTIRTIGADDHRRRRAVQRPRADRRGRQAGVDARRAAHALQRGRSQQLQRHRATFRDAIRALRDQVVLVGGHLDSWHTATGCTDNADGAIAVMEAARILHALGAAAAAHDSLCAVERRGARDCLARARTCSSTSPTPAARDQLAVYLNDDPGSGKTLGFYMEGNARRKRCSIAGSSR